MTRVPLPPQAYTREMLAQAYLWLQSQSDSIKAMAQTPDVLVGIYLRAKRNGEASLELIAPVSKDTFRASLKNLASEMDQFNSSPSHPSPPSETKSIPSNASLPPTPALPTEPQISLKERLGSDCYESLNKVKKALHLSSDWEVVRMLLSLGYLKISSSLPELFQKPPLT